MASRCESPAPDPRVEERSEDTVGKGNRSNGQERLAGSEVGDRGKSRSRCHDRGHERAQARGSPWPPGRPEKSLASVWSARTAYRHWEGGGFLPRGASEPLSRNSAN